MTERKRQSEKKLLCEPVTRPDGVVIKLWHHTRYNALDIEHGFSSWYTKEEVEFLGNGNFFRGAYKIGQAYYVAGSEELYAGLKLFANILKEQRK